MKTKTFRNGDWNETFGRKLDNGAYCYLVYRDYGKCDVELLLRVCRHKRDARAYVKTCSIDTDDYTITRERLY